MTDALEMNIAGRLMLMLARLGVRDAHGLAAYQGAVSAAVRRRVADRPPDGAPGTEALLDEQLALLESALRRRAAARAEPLRSPAVEGGAEAPGHESAVAGPPEATPPATETAPDGPTRERRHRRKSGYVPPVRSMEEKLQEERKPVQRLLLEDCVALGLVDGQEAGRLVAGMSGKTCQDAERDIVERLRQVLQDQVKAFIRKARGGPWADPHAQEDLRQDIHAANSVHGVVTLCRQVVREYQAWEQERGQGGILGLFSARHRQQQP